MLNNVTIPNRYPLPHSFSFHQNFQGCQIFCQIDLVRAYQQISVADDDIYKTARTIWSLQIRLNAFRTT